MIPILIGAAVVIGGACLLNSLSDDEKKRQRRLEENYEEYREESNREYSRILHDHKRNLEQARQKTAHELWEERQRELERRKTRNRKNFDVLMEELQGQFDDRNNLLAQTNSTIESLKKIGAKEQSTELRQSSLKMILNDAFEALQRQKAYLRYLNRYKKSAKNLFERTGELLEPFQMTLPEFWPYAGKIIGFGREELSGGEFEKSIHFHVDCKFFCEDAAQVEQLFPDDEIIYCLVESYDDETFTNKISCVNGMFIHKLELSPNVQLMGTVTSHEQNAQGFPDALILDANGVKVTLRKKFFRDRRKFAPVGSRKYFYVMDFDRKKLAWVNASERIEDCLSVERFRNVPLLIKNCDVENFLAAVEKRNALETFDEWYLAPLGDDAKNFSQTKYKCQLGQKLVFQAGVIGNEFPLLCFEKFLPDEEMVAAEDVFVALDAELEAKNFDEASALSLENLRESLNLFVYLSAEFLRQRRVKANRENILFLNQWCEIMRRLVETKESGGFESVEILELLDDNKFLINPGDAAKLKNFYRQQVRKYDTPEFFIRDAGGKKIFVTFEDNFRIINLRKDIGEKFLDMLDWRVNVHVSEFPYPEIMQAQALENFRRSQMQSPALKECLLDLSRMTFKDSGLRPSAIKNPSLLRNRNQMLAVIRSVAAENFFMIQGPPGTGKTTVIKEIVWQQLRLAPASKILIVSQANVAVDNVLRGLPKMGIAREKIVRCGNDEKISDEMKDFSLDKQVELYTEKLAEPCRADLLPYRKIWRDMMNNSETQGFIGERLLKNFSVTGATCVGLAKKHFGLDRLSFDLVIADEAGKALPGELLLPINRAKKIVIIGDHKQLPPVIDPALMDETKINIKDIVDEESRDNFFDTGLFKKLYENCPADNKCMLDIQFRMPTRIGNIVSELFYGGRLRSAPSCNEKFPLFFCANIFFVNMDDDPNYCERQDITEDGKHKSGPYNEREIEVAVALLKKLRENFSERIAVITPYKNQNKKLWQKLVSEHLKSKVAVNTIDAFQGDEADVVIYCTTRAKIPTKYFSDAARLNVAFSRARNVLIIIGALKYFRKYPAGHLMQTVADRLEQYGRIVDVKNFLAEDFQTNFSSPHVTENFSEDLTETPLTVHEVEKFLPEINADNRLICRGCGQKFDVHELTEGFCARCLTDGEEYQCGNCHAKMLYTNAAQYVYHLPREEFCADCKIVWRHTCKRCGVNEVIVRARQLKDNPYRTAEDFPYCQTCFKERGEKISVTCKACGREIVYSRGHVEDLRAQGKSPSEYCKDCRNTQVQVGSCKFCGRPIYYLRAKLDELKRQGKNPSDCCLDCSKRRGEKISVTCEACGREIVYSRGHVEDLRAQGKSFYCDSCRNIPVQVGSCKFCGRPIYYTKAKLSQLRAKYGANYSPPRRCDNCK